MEVLEKCKWSIIPLKNMIEDSFYPKRFKRNYVEKDLADTVGF